MKKLITFFIFYSFFLILPAHGGDLSKFIARVIAVADGDTITVLTADNQQVKIRLYGIDCPESRQPFGNRAKQATSDAVFGKDVTVQPIETDRYGRTVGIVFMPGDETLNGLLVHEGMAWVYQQYCRQKAICDPLKELENTARSKNRGLWADKEPIPPWEWRRRR